MFYLSHRPFLLLLALLLGGAVTALAADTPDAGPTATPQEQALDRLEATADLGGEVPVIVQLRTDTLPDIERPNDQGGDVQRAKRKLGDRARLITKAQDRLATAIPGHAGRVTRYRYLPLAALHADRDTLRRLRKLPEVLSITEDRPHAPLLNGSVPSIGGNLAYAAGLTGAGWAVAVIDTGVQTSHPTFAGRVLASAEACFSGSGIGAGSGVATGTGIATITSLCPNLPACPGTNTPYPDNTACGPGAGVYCTGNGSCWHGTHVAGTAVGDHSTYRGVAPGANLIPIQVFVIQDGGLVAYDSDIIAGLEHVLTLSQGGTQIAAVNMSLGGDVYASTRQCDLESAATKTAIDALRAAGVATVIAAGNDGNKTGLSTPGCISSAVSVGATDDGTAIASFSNLAPALSVFAPGVSVYAPVPTNSIGGASGTSMATPHVAGAFAVLRQQATNKLLTPSVDNLLAALRLSGTAITYSTNSYSTPRIKLDQALTRIDAALPLPQERILDSQITPTAVSIISGAFASVDDTNAYGGSALRGTSTSQANTLRFTPTPALTPGYYDVSAWWPVRSGNPSQALVTVGSDGGQDQFAVNQQQNGSSWNLLGTYLLGTTAASPFVQFSSPSGSAGLLADAVRFELTASGVQALAVSPPSLPAGYVGTFYSEQLQITGGVPPYVFSLAGVLPSGLTFNPVTLAISGVPTAVAGNNPVTLDVTDMPGNTLSKTYDLEVLASNQRTDRIWIEDAVPTGGTSSSTTTYATYKNTAWSWGTTSPVPYSGTLAHRSGLLSGLHQHYFYSATQTLVVAAGDTLFTYVWLDPANPPRMILLQWNLAGSWEHRAYWGENLTSWGTNGSASRMRMGDLPPTGQWVRLAVPAATVGLAGATVSGMAFTLYDGTAAWDYAGASSTPVTPVSQAQFSASNYSVAESGATATITVTRTGSATGTLSVAYASSDSTATHGADYSSVSGTLTFADGDTQAKTFTVPITDDALYEGAETLTLTLSNPVGGTLGTPATAVLTITDNDPLPTAKVWIEDAVPIGGTSSSTTTYATYKNTAWSWGTTSPVPYSGTLAHRSGLLSGLHQHYFYSATQTLVVAAGDTLFTYVWLDPANPPRMILLQWNLAGSWEHRAYWGENLTSWGTNGSASRMRMGDLPPTGQWVRLAVPAATVGLAGATVSGMAFTLYDGTAAWDYAGASSTPVTPVSQAQFSASNYSVAESGATATITVTRTGSATGTLSVAYASSDSTATHGADYSSVSGTLTFADGDTQAKTFTVPITDDALYEGAETLTFTLSNPVGGTLGTPATAVLTITDNDPLPTAKIWIEDAVPIGGTSSSTTTYATYKNTAWSWGTTSPVPYSGTLAHRSGLLSGLHQHYFYSATQTLVVAAGDTLFTYVWLDPANPPRMILLQWNLAGSWEHRAYWGENLTSWGTNGSASRMRMGDLPPTGQWVRLAVPAATVGLAGTTVSGMAFTLYDGTAAWDYAGAGVTIP